ncbi:hybrid sensor histidine kinase/response regulator [Profundibacter sp.]
MKTSHPISQPKRRRRLMPIAVAGAAVLLLILAVMLALSNETSNRFRKIKTGWEEYSHAADPRGLWISEIRGYFGYGGMIHNFKNYVLRQEEIYEETLRAQSRLLLNAISTYQAASPDPVEQDALVRIKRVVEEYSRNIEVIKQGIAEHKSAEEIDALVRVDDSDALRALAVLERHWLDQRQRNLDTIVAALSDGDALVRSLAGVMVLLTALVGLIALMIFALVGSALRSNAAQLKELEARKSAQTAERKLAWVVQQSPASIMITDTHGKIEFANRKLLEMTGYSEEELVGKSPSILKSGHTPEGAYQDIWKRLSQGEPWRGVFKNLRKDGSHYWAATSLLPLLNEEGEITNYIGVGEDITEKRHVDEQIAQVQKMEAVGILAGSVAHDFNNVLMTIIGNTELIKLESEDMDAPEDVRASIEHIEIASRRARALIQQLLTFARQQPGQARRLELHHAVDEALELIRVSTPPTVQIEFKPAVDRVATDIDPTAFFQIVMNLCHNAVEAIGDKGGRIELRLDRISRGTKGGLKKLPKGALGTIKLEIDDNGPGIPQDIQEKIFEPFFSTKPVGKGTGLGLAIVRNWVEEAGGKVHLQSSREAGTCFTLLFPEFEVTESQTEQQSRPQMGHEHILLVDDEEELLYTIRRMMARLGYRVEAFSNPALALHAFRTNPDSYDAVVTDMMMPEMNGAELITALHEIRPELPAMVISSYMVEGSLPEDLKDVVTVQKPVNMVGLAHAMRLTIDQSQG